MTSSFHTNKKQTMQKIKFGNIVSIIDSSSIKVSYKILNQHKIGRMIKTTKTCICDVEKNITATVLQIGAKVSFLMNVKKISKRKSSKLLSIL